MKSESEFQAFYQSALLPALHELEADRMEIVRVMRGFLWPFVIVLAIFLVAVINMPNDGNTDPGILGTVYTITALLLVFMIVVYALYYIFSLSGKIKQLKGRFKGEVVSKMVKFVDESLQYTPEGGIDRNEYSHSSIFKSRVDKFASEDLISGTLGKTAIRFSEVHSQIKVESGSGKDKTTEWKTIFKGIMFVADFNKNFNGRTVVLADTAEGLLGSLGTFLQKMNVQRDPLIKLEDEEFERSFAVYGTDPVEARYILSPSLMQRIVAFQRKSGRINLSFVDSKLFIAIPIPPQVNLFEPKVFSSLLKFDLVARYNNYLMLAVGIVEDLNLNTRIWTKE